MKKSQGNQIHLIEDNPGTGEAKMDERTKELAAIAASVACHCRECLEFHLGKASEMGIPREDIDKAIEIGTKVSEVSNRRMREFAGIADCGTS